jgi:Protein of unknown function (DUF1569)
MSGPRDAEGPPVVRPLRLRTFDQAIAELERLQAASAVVRSPGWDVPHMLDHCARSIAYSMQGFPQLKPVLFRAVVGAAAFHVFDWRGEMRHDLSAEIPGDPGPAQVLPFDAALQALRQRIADFDRWTGALQPHFAYGTLTKAQYERAHAMHLANHLATLDYDR